MDEFQTRQFWNNMKKTTFDLLMEKAITYRKLKEILDSLDESQLDTPVRWGGDNTSGVISDTWIVEEDQINPSGDGWEPVSVYDNDPEFDMSDEPIVCKKGTVILITG